MADVQFVCYEKPATPKLQSYITKASLEKAMTCAVYPLLDAFISSVLQNREHTFFKNRRPLRESAL